MGVSVPPPPDWEAVVELYRQLATAEKFQPGSPPAQDVEDSILILILGQTSSSDRQHARFDAVRRARFLRHQAARQRPAVLAKLTGPAVAPVPRVIDGDEPDEPGGEPIEVTTPEDIICFQETVRELTRPVRSGSRRYAGQVLDGLLDGRPAADIAAQIGVSRSTVDRCIGQLRTDCTRLYTAARAA